MGVNLYAIVEVTSVSLHGAWNALSWWDLGRADELSHTLSDLATIYPDVPDNASQFAKDELDGEFWQVFGPTYHHLPKLSAKFARYEILFGSIALLNLSFGSNWRVLFYRA